MKYEMAIGKRLFASLFSFAFVFLMLASPGSFAAEAVRLAITAQTGSGIEQEIVDYISAHFKDSSSVVVSTVNPDWCVQCKIIDNQDRMTGQIRYNGTVTVKTADGQVVSTVSVQKYNQDFSSQVGTPLNKQLVDSAAREVISVVGQRATEKIEEAVEIELKTRDQIGQAESLANNDKYEDAISTLKEIGRDSVHFQTVQKTIVQYEVEKRALQLVHDAEVKAKQGQYTQAITTLKDVDPCSKRYKLSKQLTVKYRNLLAAAQARVRAKKLAKNNDNETSKTSTLH